MNASSSYSLAARLFHWSMALIIIGVWLIGFYSANLRGDVPRGGPAVFVHKAIASTVLFLLLARLCYRLSHRYPAMPGSVSRAMSGIAHIAHALLYLVAMLAVPLSGWYWSSVAGHPIPLLGLFNLPPIAPVDQSRYDLAMWIHRLLSWGAGALILVHVLAALKHHFFDKDDILARMLPRVRRRG
ncbi:cytochrome b [Pseudomonas chlororaphis]|uniref:cytochrome b n=1 Tax=Pseudomonas chlororaphis TaxID=587753 RepID=UPI001B33E29A|nr:cytochrome b [Pseudomonas chlororaphis]MBP5074785.1 cytochrome b [Pseudomonas chlororaphis]